MTERKLYLLWEKENYDCEPLVVWAMDAEKALMETYDTFGGEYFSKTVKTFCRTGNGTFWDRFCVEREIETGVLSPPEYIVHTHKRIEENVRHFFGDHTDWAKIAITGLFSKQPDPEEVGPDLPEVPYDMTRYCWAHAIDEARDNEFDRHWRKIRGVERKEDDEPQAKRLIPWAVPGRGSER